MIKKILSTLNKNNKNEDFQVLEWNGLVFVFLLQFYFQVSLKYNL